ncbi:hypothetical protein [Halobellus salinisoli]|uniref:hypothetical protein n=1 Tax=Halobellus salinisoli TaxID=3108500 RepID=UPI00300B8521
MSDDNEDYELFTGVDDVEDEKGHKSDEEANSAFENYKPDISALEPEDRPRGILSGTDREYLCGLRDYSHQQSELNRRQAIRERTINALKDFNLLWLLLGETEWKKVFDTFETDELNDTFAAMLSFMYLGIGQDPDRMEKILEHGLYLGANYSTSGRWSGKANDVDVSIDIDYDPDIEALYERVEEGEGDQLTPGEIGALVQSGKLEPGDLEKLEKTGPGFPSVYVGGDSTTGSDRSR